MKNQKSVIDMTEEELDSFMETDAFWEMKAPIAQGKKKKSKEDTLEEFLPFEHIQENYERFTDWGFKSKKLRYWRNCHGAFKKMWDGYKKPEAMDYSSTVINYLRDSFPESKAAVAGRPLGDFKDLMVKGSTHESVYYSLIEKYIEPQYNGKSYLEVAIPYCQDLFDDCFQEESKYLTWNSDAFYVGLSLMAFTSSIGIILEQRAHKDLKKWLKSFPKAAERFKYEPAEASDWESKDVDGIFVDRKNGNVAVKVSIKTMRALTESFIMGNYRGFKKKLEPQIYAGYTDINEDLSFFEVDGDLKQLLKNYLKGASGA